MLCKELWNELGPTVAQRAADQCQLLKDFCSLPETVPPHDNLDAACAAALAKVKADIVKETNACTEAIKAALQDMFDRAAKDYDDATDHGRNDAFTVPEVMKAFAKAVQRIRGN